LVEREGSACPIVQHHPTKPPLCLRATAVFLYGD
jgi:hypothetical protein